MNGRAHRHDVVCAIVAVLMAALAVPASGEEPEAGRLRILDAEMVEGHIIRVRVATGELQEEPADPPELALDAWPGGIHAHGSVWLVGIPRRLPIPIDVDLSEGAVKVGAVKLGEFPPVPRFTENVRFPVHVTLRQGTQTSSADRTVTVLLPAVIIPGYANELTGPDNGVLDGFRRRGYRDGGAAPTLFWFDYPSHELTLDQAARALAAYVRHTVLPSAYAGKINVVAYSFGGLMARWDVQFDVDAWAALVNQLVLVGVPNEGSLFAYLYRNVPRFMPYGYLVHTPAAQAMLPTFPYWRASTAEPWSAPPAGTNLALAELNTRPMPNGVQIEVLYGSGQRTLTGVTANGPATFAPGDGIVPAASAEGLPMQGGSGVPALLAANVAHVDLGAVGHLQLLSAAVVDRVTTALLRRIDSSAAASPPPAPQGQ